MLDFKCDLPIKQQVSNPKCQFESATSLDVKASSIISSCRICLSSILDPAALTCGHRFCEKCLHQYWRIREKPDYIVCPLCRACAFNVNFAKTEQRESTEDFRKMFSVIQNMSELDINNAFIQCLKISILIPALYCLVKWFKLPLIDLFKNLHAKLTRTM